VVFESLAIFEPLVVDKASAVGPVVTIPTPAVVESPAMVARPVARESAVARKAPAVVETNAVVDASTAAKPAAAANAAAAFERAAVLDLMTPVSVWRAWPPLEGVPIEVPGIPAPAAAKQEVPDWSALMASLREDMERRRGHDKVPTLKVKPRTKTAKPAVDEWGFFDPEQCGFSALLAKLDEITSA
jgi:hypothetical protein